ncbi:DUF418 domain-containing protein [Quadrisphaera setariae]|uniref:DUF418 domain-containing protein n=1 Tax=Quadrisphaera setariae TaxID=2593304 RepID=A0A5C8ZHW2_9ACTN|nr:DUF418 domain-containing protein [Quadrisphaera setariae]TXR56693.1 DUF418 domain-containing protein [Quadrisphaera setariae]
MEQPSARSAALDLARGVAVLGTLATNVWIFTDPQGFVGYTARIGSSARDLAGWGGVEVVAQQLAQGKFLGLLTLLFGIGLELQRRSALRRGSPWPGRYPLRAALLLLDGAVNYVLVAEFDVLMGYAVTGVVVAYLLATSERAQRAWLVTAAAVHLVVLTALGLLLSGLPEVEQQPLAPNPYADGSFWALAAFRVDNAAAFRAEPVLIGALSVALFLTGSQLVRRGLLEAGSQRGARLRRRLLVTGAVALGVDLALGLFGGVAGVVVARYGTAPLVAGGLLAAAVELERRRPTPAGAERFARARLAEVGRTALSCYVLQNLLAGALCYGWGAGLAAATPDALRVPVTLTVYAAVCVAVVAAAWAWLHRFERGPLELLTHRVLAAAATQRRASSLR